LEEEIHGFPVGSPRFLLSEHPGGVKSGEKLLQIIGRERNAFFAGVAEGAEEHKRVITQISLSKGLQALLYFGSQIHITHFVTQLTG